jgi:hypothetical protein
MPNHLIVGIRGLHAVRNHKKVSLRRGKEISMEIRGLLTRLFSLLPFPCGLLVLRVVVAFLCRRFLALLGWWCDLFFLRLFYVFVFWVVFALGHRVEFRFVKRWLRRVIQNKQQVEVKDGIEEGLTICWMAIASSRYSPRAPPQAQRPSDRVHRNYSA